MRLLRRFSKPFLQVAKDRSIQVKRIDPQALNVNAPRRGRNRGQFSAVDPLQNPPKHCFSVAIAMIKFLHGIGSWQQLAIRIVFVPRAVVAPERMANPQALAIEDRLEFIREEPTVSTA